MNRENPMPDSDTKIRHMISLGAGVQSSTMALMAAHGEIEPMPEMAIFADTGWEPRAVYDWLDHLEMLLPYPVVRVSKPGPGLRAEQIDARVRPGKGGGRWVSLPYFTAGNSIGRLRRQCTAEYKIEPIERYSRREVIGLAPRQHAPREVVISQWRGITADEASRMKPSRHPWMQVRYPLAMEHLMTRKDCLAWMRRNGYPEPPRSACIGCPYHSGVEWRDMRDNRPDEWADAVEFDAAIRSAGGVRGETFLHRLCLPLPEAVGRKEDDGQLALWGEECEGMCGV